MATTIVPQYVDDLSILLIDHDTTSVTSLMSMLEQFSKNVMSVDVASQAISMIEKQKKDIGLIIANIETPHIDSQSFLTALLHKDIPLILIYPEMTTKKPSDLLTKRACFFLYKPISESNIKNMWQHVLSKESQEFKEIDVSENQEDQIEAFRANLKRQRTSQASLLGKRPFIGTFTTSETYQQRKSIANVEWKGTQGFPIEIEDKGKELKKFDSKIRRRRSLWTNERHMKFLAAISILGEKELLSKSILEIMNDPKLTHRQVASHLKKYKAQTGRISETLPKNEWKSTDKAFEYPTNYEYPFKASNLTKNLIASNSLWNSLRKKNSASSSTTQFLFKKPIAERKKNTSKFHLEGKKDMSNHSFSGNIFNKPSMDINYVPSTISNNPPSNILPTDNVNHVGLVSTSSENLPILSGLPSNPFEANKDQMDWVPSSENHSHHETMNHMEWVPSTENYVLPKTDMNINFPFPEIHTDHMDGVSLGEGYVPFENMIPAEVGINQIGIGYSGGGIVSQEETNTNHVGFVSSGMHYGIPPQTNMTILETTNYSNPTSFEPNTIQNGLVSCETSYAALNDMVPFETNMEEMNYVPEGFDIPIEDLISFDIDVDEKDMPSWLEDSIFPQGNNPLPPSYLDHDPAFGEPMNTTPHTIMEDHDHSVGMNLGSTRQQDNMMESCEYHNIEAVNQRDDMEEGDNFDNPDCVDCIYQMIN